MTYQIESAGYVHGYGQSWEVKTKSGAWVGIVSERFKSGLVKVYFNGSCTKGSARKFYSVQEALDFIHQRRVKKGYKTV